METLLTRRQTLQSLAYSAVFASPLLSLVGCGGGGGHHGGGSSTDTANVAVQLPSGFSIPATDLVAGTAYGTGAISNGAFKAKVSSNGPTFAYLQQKSTGKFVLFGLVGAGRPGVTPLATAALTMAIALDITGLPGKNLAQALALLEADPSVQALGTAIATAMASDPYAANGTNDAVKAAIKTTYEALSGTGSPSAVRPEAISRASLLLVSPTGEQGGFRLDQVEDGTITPTNLKRRPAVAYTYLVGHATADASTDVSPASRVDVQEVAATATLLESVASLGVHGAFGPRAGKAVSLPVTSGDVRTLYSTVVLMASTDQGAEPAFFADARYANEVAEWRQRRKDLNAAGFVGIVHDIFAPVVASDTSLAVSEASALLASFTASVAAANQAAYLAAAQAGQYGELAQFTVGEIGFEGYTEAQAVSFISQCVGLAPSPGPVVAKALLAYAAVAAATLAVATAALALGDLAASYYDVVSSPQAELWTATAIKPSVVVSPATGTLSAGGSLTLTVATPGTSETLYKFHWTLSSGGNGNIGDPTGAVKPGRDITTAGNSINLLTASSDTQGTAYTVTVEAIEIKTGASLGKTRATITIAPVDPGLPGALFTKSGACTGAFAGEYFAWAFVRFDPVPGKQFYSAVGLKDGKAVGDGFVSTDAFPYLLPDGTTLTNCVCVYGSPGAAGSPYNGDDLYGSSDQAAFYLNRFLDVVSGADYRVYAK